MPISKVGQRRQVVIPKEIFEALGLQLAVYIRSRASRRSAMPAMRSLLAAMPFIS